MHGSEQAASWKMV